MRYVLDPSESRFTIQAFARGALAVFGHSPTFLVRNFKGELDWPGDNASVSGASFQLTVAADSLSLTDHVSAKDREEIERTMHREVLETESYPEIAFHSTEITNERIVENWHRLHFKGRLDLHGISRVTAIDAQLRIMDESIRLSGEFSLMLSAYRIKRVSALAGMITLQDELKAVFDILGTGHE
jgi:polyisoprenoid-binding protein YceI